MTTIDVQQLGSVCGGARRSQTDNLVQTCQLFKAMPEPYGNAFKGIDCNEWAAKSREKQAKTQSSAPPT